MSIGGSDLFKGTAGARAAEADAPIGFDETPPESAEETSVSTLDGLPDIVITGGLTGKDTKVTIDGREINYLESVRFEARAGQVSKVILSVFPRSVTICTLGEVQEHEVGLFPFDRNREAEECEHSKT